MKKNNIVIACDPSTKASAFAIFESGSLREYRKVKTNFKDIVSFFSSFKKFSFVIEDQYLNTNPKTLIKLVAARTQILTVAQMQGATHCQIVNPQSWQRVMLGMSIKAKRDQRKEISKIVASEIAKEKITDSDIADAICIGEYFVRVSRLKTA